MAYTLHVTGISVTVARAEQFSKEYNLKIKAGYIFGKWFCFTMAKVANLEEDKLRAANFFEGALVETSKERNDRHAAMPVVKRVSEFTSEIHHEIAASIQRAHPNFAVIELEELDVLVSEANEEYSKTHGELKHYASDFYAVQSMMRGK